MSRSILEKRSRIGNTGEPVSEESKAKRLRDDIKLDHNAYTVGWICALPKEQTVAIAMLDQVHLDLPKLSNDDNTYTLGSIDQHNIVIACLPKGKYGQNSAATAATQMVSTFPAIRISLMVGIGGGIPPKVRLGDVVVSTPVAQYPGVIQWDMGKAEKDGKFRRTGALNSPPRTLLTALAKLQSIHDLSGSKIRQYLDEVENKWPRLVPKYTRSSSLEDPLSTSNDCRQEPKDIIVHYGLIASGNQVIKDSEFRDSLNKTFDGNILCVEMEAAALMDKWDFPCIVIRGICDYADSAKNKDWQEYAAAVSAAFAKELLVLLQSNDVRGERAIKDVLIEINETMARTNATVEIVKLELENKDDREVLHWLTPIDYGSQYSDFIGRRQPKTGQWLKESQQYQNWLNKSKETLFCPGIPGAGKTILASIVINDITERFQNDILVGIAFIYFNFKSKDTQKVEDLLSSLLKQLAQQHALLPQSVKDLRDLHKRRGTRPLLIEISETIGRVATKYSKIFLVIDALDECQITDNHRARFLAEIFKLQDKFNVNIFMTSRFLPEVLEAFQNSIKLEIRAHDDDVRRYLEARISQSRSKVLETCREEIKDKITEVIDGMFLLAQLHFDSIKTKKTPKKVQQALKILRKGSDAYNSAYDAAMERIEEQDLDSRKLAKDVLSWVFYAKRPLNTAELLTALGVEVGALEFDEQNMPGIEDAVSVCAGLVTVDEESRIIRLVHYTIQEYFEQTKEHWFKNGEAQITFICTTYLSFTCFENGYHITDEELKQLFQRNPLYDYAMRNWANHAKSSAIETEPLVLGFLRNDDAVATSGRAMTVDKEVFWQYLTPLNQPETGLHLTAYFGLSNALKSLLQDKPDPNSKNSNGDTPLSLAAQNGQIDVVKVLLLYEHIDPNPKNFNEMTPLSLAVQNGHGEVIRILLLDNRVNPNTKDYSGTTPLSWAMMNNHIAILQLLLQDSRINPNIKDDSLGETPLIWAAKNDHIVMIEHLLQNNHVDPSIEGCRRETILSWAVVKGHIAIVQQLLQDSRIDPNRKDYSGATPLLLAAKNDHMDVFQLLLQNISVDPNIKDNQLREAPLLWAARNGRAGMVQQLLQNSRVNPKIINNFGETPLIWAVKKEQIEVLQLLLQDSRIDPNIGDSFGETPLICAVKKGHIELLQLLLHDSRIDPDVKNCLKETALSVASRIGHAEVVSLLQQSLQK